MARIGWRGTAVPTLEEIGRREGLTRERVRQLQVKLEDRLEGSHPPDEPALILAVDLLGDIDLEPTKQAGQLLAENALVRDPLPEAGVELMFSLLDRLEVFDAYQARYRDRQPFVKEALHVAKDLTRSVGVASVDWVVEDSGAALDVGALHLELDNAPWCRRLDEDWFWDPMTPPGRNRLVNLTTKMLAASGSLDLRNLRDGLERNVRLGRMPHLPSLHALRLFYDAHPDFSIDDQDAVTSGWQLDPEEELDTNELILYRILRRAPDGFLDRAELFHQATAAGMNQNSFSVYSSYSSIVENPVPDRWVLRGTQVSPAVMEAHRRRRKQRYARNEWTSRGTLRLERETPDYWTLVVSVPRALRSYLVDRAFDAVDAAGTSVGRVKWDGNGTSWGYTIFLQGQSAKDGDILVADFNLVMGAVELSLRQRQRDGEE